MLLGSYAWTARFFRGQNRHWPQGQISGAFGHGGGQTMGWGPNGSGRGVYRGHVLAPSQSNLGRAIPLNSWDKKRTKPKGPVLPINWRSPAAVPDGNDPPGTEAISGSNDSSPDQASFTTQHTVFPYW